jgi:hypothetical protein
MTLTKAFDHMTSMAHHINEMKRKHEHAVRVQEIQSQLEDYEGEDLTRLGELVLEVCTLIKTTTSCSIRQFSPGTPVSSLKKKPECHDITEILLKLELNTITLTPSFPKLSDYNRKI